MNDFLMWAGGAIVTVASTIIGWVFKMIFARLDKHTDLHDLHDKTLEAFKLTVAKEYAVKSEVERGFDRIVDKLELIFEKLDKKVDK